MSSKSSITPKAPANKGSIMNFFTVTPSANATLAGGNVTAKKDVSLFNKPPLQSSGKMTDTAKNVADRKLMSSPAPQPSKKDVVVFEIDLVETPTPDVHPSSPPGAGCGSIEDQLGPSTPFANTASPAPERAAIDTSENFLEKHVEPVQEGTVEADELTGAASACGVADIATKAPVKRKRAPKLKPAAVEVVAAEPGTCTTTVSTEETTKNKTKAKKVEKPDEGATTTTPTDELRVLPDSATQAAAAETTCDVAIPESVVKKMDLFQCKMTESVRELTCLESCDDCADTETGPLRDLASLLTPAASINTEWEAAFKCMLSRYIQGSALPLSQLVASIGQRAVVDLNALSLSETERAELADITAYLRKNFDVSILALQIATMAERTAYGPRESKSAPIAEENDSLAILRWEVVNSSLFPSRKLAVIAEAKRVRKRYGELLKVLRKYVDQCHKTPEDSAKLCLLEEKCTKAMRDIETAKEKRNEAEQKRAADREAKARKDEESNLKKKAKDDEKSGKDRKLKQDEKKRKGVDEKQASRFLSFLKPVAESSKPSSKPVPKASARAVRDSSAFEAAVSAGMTMNQIIAINRDKYSAGQNYAGRRVRRRKMLKITVTVQIAVPEPGSENIDGVTTERPVTESENAVDPSKAGGICDPVVQSNGDGAFAAATQQYFSELREVCVDSRLRVFHFHEDYRPPYRGTFSKKSSVISGRRPFARDSEQLNYEYDSEEEYEEEDADGEDIGDSEGEDDGEDNELVFDDFFKRDEDAASDLDSDGEEMAVAKLSRRREHRNVVGPRFVASQGSSVKFAPVASSEDAASCSAPSTPQLVLCLADANDAVLRRYPAVKFSRYDDEVFAVNDCFTFDDPYLGVGVDGAGFPDNLSSDLAKFIIMKRDGADKLVEAFHAEHVSVPKNQIKKKISQIAYKYEDPRDGMQKWFVYDDLAEQLGVDSLMPKRERKVKKGDGPVQTQQDITDAFILASESMSDNDAAKYFIQNWDEILKTRYPWQVLWPRLQSLGWTKQGANDVYIPHWSREKYEKEGMNLKKLDKNRDFFSGYDDIRNYIAKYETHKTDAPPTPGRPRRSNQQQLYESAVISNSMKEEPFLNALKSIMDGKVAAAYKRKLESSQDGSSSDADQDLEGSSPKSSRMGDYCSSDVSGGDDKENLPPDDQLLSVMEFAGPSSPVAPGAGISSDMQAQSTQNGETVVIDDA